MQAGLRLCYLRTPKDSFSHVKAYIVLISEMGQYLSQFVRFCYLWHLCKLQINFNGSNTDGLYIMDN